MPDEIDIAQECEHIIINSAIDDVRAKAAAIEPGTPSDCDRCGEWSGRLVRGVCAPC